ncbi:hypothetical protein C7S18_04795 [Ahniella affigens]|uniref:Uncharacterized protein n=1 Tax=Ahniella affigens TaxID=2021234 RepID=A0A2P1PNY9_9GAMM|nr:hypothetical protein [Ahniella affigens]AVP96559.1 hypothetical protein C7S18_04795 [Ahniella affigens]
MARISERRQSASAQLRKQIRALLTLERVSLTLGRLTERELSLVFILLADQLSEIRRSLAGLALERSSGERPTKNRGGSNS